MKGWRNLRLQVAFCVCGITSAFGSPAWPGASAPPHATRYGLGLAGSRLRTRHWRVM